MTEENELQNVNFVQFNKNVMQQWRALVRKSPVAVEIMYFIIEKMSHSNAVVCSYKVLEEITGTSRATVARAIRVLKDGRWIESIKVGSAQAYVVNERVAWQTSANRRQYAIFRATVVAAQSEQKPVEQTGRLMKLPVLMNGERPLIHDDENTSPPDQSEMDLL